MMAYETVAQTEEVFLDTEVPELPPLTQPKRQSTSISDAMSIISGSDDILSPTARLPSRPRTVSRDDAGPMRHPTPDLQSLQGAYVGNIERLEDQAERISIHSDIGEEIRKMRDEQKRSDSRRSSLLSLQRQDSGRNSPPLRRQLSQLSSSSSSRVSNASAALKNSLVSPAPLLPFSRHPSQSNLWSPQNSIIEHVAVASGPTSAPSTAQSAEEPALAAEAFDPDSPSLRRAVASLSTHDALSPTQKGDMETASIAESQLRQSNDTARQASTLFADFDGVHASDQRSLIEVPEADQRSLIDKEQPEPEPPRRPLQSTRSQQQLPRDDMVFYPAPVPMMLNLPQRLSKMPAHPHSARRKSEMALQINRDRKSAAVAWPASPSPSTAHFPSNSADHPINATAIETMDAAPEGLKLPPPGDLGKMPPQLRASMFFDHQPRAQQEVRVMSGSAVATLDSILDASAGAPVSAFTDHPYAGEVGAEIYRVPKPGFQRGKSGDLQSRRNSSANILSDETRRNSSANVLSSKPSGDLVGSVSKRHSLMSLGNHFRRKSSNLQLEQSVEQDHAEADNGAENPTEEAVSELHSQHEGSITDSLEEPAQVPPSQPTTLLAELQQRKEEQSIRKKTAATAFPDGLHSTLLEMDAVAQVQKKARKQRRTRLAWEDPTPQDAADDEQGDEEVPLGVLYPSSKLERQRHEEDAPLGLLALRQMEESEPLSHRRARLRGEPAPMPLNVAYQEYVPGEAGPSTGEDDHPGETLAERIKRLKATRIPSDNRRVSGDFASEIMSHLGVPDPQPEATGKEEPEEETLGQRRRRLRAEAGRAGPAARVVIKSGLTTSLPPATNVDQNASVVQKRKSQHSLADVLTAHPVISPSTHFHALSNGQGIGDGQYRSTSNGTIQQATSWTARQVSNSTNNGVAAMSMSNGLTTTTPMNTVTGMGTGCSREDEMMYDEGLGKGKGDMIQRWRQGVLY